MANKFTGITSAGVNVPVYDKEAHQALGNVYTKSEVDIELNTKQDNLSTEQLYNIDHALTTSAGLASEAWVNDQGFAKESDIPTTAGLMEESKLGIEDNHITAYNGIPFGAETSSDIVYFDYNSGDPELSWSEIKTYMDNGKELIIYDRTAVEDGRTKMGYVSNYDKANNFIQFNNVSNSTSAGKAITGINWAYLGNNLGWQRTGAQGGGATEYTAGANIDITDNVISGKSWTDEIDAKQDILSDLQISNINNAMMTSAIQYVATSAEAIAGTAGVLYVVTGTGA